MIFLTQHERVVDDAAEEVGGEDDDRPGRVPHDEEDHGQLDEDEAEHLPLERRVHAEQLLYLGVLFWNKKGKMWQ